MQNITTKLEALKAQKHSLRTHIGHLPPPVSHLAPLPANLFDDMTMDLDQVGSKRPRNDDDDDYLRAF
jgi:hypothetical protein